MSQNNHHFSVSVSGCTAPQAEQVMNERISVDEDYGFDYEIGFESAVSRGVAVPEAEVPRSPFLAIGGWMASGKDAFADHLVSRHGWVKVGMGEIILAHMLLLNPWIKVTVRDGFRLRLRPGFHRATALVDRLGYVEAKTIADFRTFMQRDGTDAGRDFIDPEVWVTAMRRHVERLLTAGHRVVMTGTRFPNELQMARALGARSIWIDRPGVVQTESSHESELALSPADFDSTVVNDGSLNDLYEKADTILTQPGASVDTSR